MAYAECDPAGKRIIVTTRYEEKELIKAVPGSRWDATEKHWTVPLTWPACLQLRGLFGQTLTLGDELIKWATAQRKHIDRMMQLRARLEPDQQDESYATIGKW